MEQNILDLIEEIIFTGWDDRNTQYIPQLISEPSNELVEEVKNILKIYKQCLTNNH